MQAHDTDRCHMDDVLPAFNAGDAERDWQPFMRDEVDVLLQQLVDDDRVFYVDGTIYKTS